MHVGVMGFEAYILQGIYQNANDAVVLILIFFNSVIKWFGRRRHVEDTAQTMV